ncbi:MAG: hypothetical protein ACOYI4_02100 [Christensenellales bacterium]|jgi:hypothetical protein
MSALYYNKYIVLKGREGGGVLAVEQKDNRITIGVNAKSMDHAGKWKLLLFKRPQVFVALPVAGPKDTLSVSRGQIDEDIKGFSGFALVADGKEWDFLMKGETQPFDWGLARQSVERKLKKKSERAGEHTADQAKLGEITTPRPKPAIEVAAENQETGTQLEKAKEAPKAKAAGKGDAEPLPSGELGVKNEGYESSGKGQEETTGKGSRSDDEYDIFIKKWPQSRWKKVYYPGTAERYYILGEIYERETLKARCYAVPGYPVGNIGRGETYIEENGKGYWLIFQSPYDGKMMESSKLMQG